MSISLTQPSVGSTNWGSAVNANWAAIESAINSIRATRTISGTDTVVASDNGKLLLCNAASAFTLTLSAAATLGNGFWCTIMKTNADTTTGTGALTIDANSAETINGALTNRLQAQYSYITIVCDGSNWFVTDTNDFISVSAAFESLTGSGVVSEIAALDIPNGEWELAFRAGFYLNGATTANWAIAIGATSASYNGTTEGDSLRIRTLASPTSDALDVPCRRIVQTSGAPTTPWYANANSAYTVGTPQIGGVLQARRVG